MIFKTLILSILFSISSNNLENEKIVFSIIQENRTIGEMSGQKSMTSESTTYNSSSTAITKKVIKIKVHSEYQVKMQEGKLQSASAKIKVKGIPYANCQTEFCKDNCKSKDSNTKITNQTILFTTTMLLFEEPNNMSSVYNELDGTFHSLRKIGNHVYLKTNPQGKKSWYYYKNEKLEKAIIETEEMNFSLVRKKTN